MAISSQEWEENFRLGDACYIKHGFAFKGEDMTTEPDSSLPIVVNIGNFQYTGGFRFETTKIQRMTRRYPSEYELTAGDILVVMTCQTPKGEILGIPGRIPNDGRTYLHNQRMGLAIITDPEKLDHEFLYWLFLYPDFNNHLFATSTGTKILHTAPIRIENYNFRRPPLETQRKIAAILSAYDDLIENNTQRIQALEAAAQALYREWFVEFRFPGHESVAFVPSELGDIPAGWEIKSVGEILAYDIGGGWGEEMLDEKYIVPAYVIRGTDIPQARYGDILTCPLRFHTKSNFASRELKHGDVVFEVSGGSKGQPVGRALLINQTLLNSFDESVICASFCKLLRVDPEIFPSVMFYLHLTEIYKNGQIDKYQVQSTGITNFKFAFFLQSEKLPIPSNRLKSEFNIIAEPIFEEIQILGKKNSVLREARDSLLPRLISGELDVSELEIELEGTAQ